MPSTDRIRDIARAAAIGLWVACAMLLTATIDGDLRPAYVLGGMILASTATLAWAQAAFAGRNSGDAEAARIYELGKIAGKREVRNLR